MPRAVRPAEEAAGEPADATEETSPATGEAPAEETAAAPTTAKAVLLRVQCNAHQRIQLKHEERVLLMGTHDITEPALAKAIKALVEDGAKRQIFIL